MKIKLEKCLIEKQNTQRYIERCIDKSSKRRQYFFNVCKSLSIYENMLYELGFYDIKINQSPFSNSCYLTMKKDSIKGAWLRISDHSNGAMCFENIDELLSFDGSFHLNKSFIYQCVKFWALN